MKRKGRTATILAGLGAILILSVVAWFYWGEIRGSQVWEGAVVWSAKDGGTGQIYEVVTVPGGVDWSAANSAAIARGGYLVTISSPAENEFVNGLVTSPEFWASPRGRAICGPWLGAVQPPGSPEPAGNWQWVTGEPFSYADWGPAQPNDEGGNEDRICFMQSSWIGGVGYRTFWSDQPGTYKLAAYIVEYERRKRP